MCFVSAVERCEKGRGAAGSRGRVSPYVCVCVCVCACVCVCRILIVSAALHCR